jgi:hypothetical protein
MNLRKQKQCYPVLVPFVAVACRAGGGRHDDVAVVVVDAAIRERERAQSCSMVVCVCIYYYDCSFTGGTRWSSPLSFSLLLFLAA